MPAPKSTLLQKFLILPLQIAGAVTNMARDAAMLDHAASHRLPLLRFYQWNEPAITFGYSQRWQEIRMSIAPFTGTCLRRLTGGGIVDHRGDHTYALALPPSHPACRMPAPQLYRSVHAALADLLEAHGIPAGLAPCPRHCDKASPAPPPKPAAKACFTAPEADDVVLRASGRKLAGAALKRNRRGLLLQGSLFGPELATLRPNELARQLAGRLARSWQAMPVPLEQSPLDPATIAHWEAHFADPAWNQRR